VTDERKLLLLGLLRQTDMHGYMLNEHLGGTAPVTLKKPTAYNLLDRMEKDGWVAGRDESTGGRPRKVYSVTEKGEEAFYRLLREQVSVYAPNESPAMVSIGFLDALETSEARELLERRRDSARVYRTALGSQADDAHGHAGTGYLPIEYARRLAELDIAFLDEVIEAIEREEENE
jgi:DNA-binding PadR family transcriptional regulator